MNQSRQKKKKASRSHRVGITDNMHKCTHLYSFWQLFSRRQAVVRPNEKALWDGLSVYYMTDESDNSDDGSIVKHKLPWRSESKLMCLDVN